MNTIRVIIPAPVGYDRAFRADLLTTFGVLMDFHQVEGSVFIEVAPPAIPSKTDPSVLTGSSTYDGVPSGEPITREPSRSFAARQAALPELAKT